MPRKRTKSGPTASTGAELEGNHLTSGDIARMLHVDLKTIHNWVKQQHICGSRTKGRHLRFERSEVVRFMREYGYPVPTNVGAAAPRLLLEETLGGSWVTALKRAAHIEEAGGLFGCALELAGGSHEIVVLDLDTDPKRASELTQAIRRWEPTQRVVVLGLGGKSAAKKGFFAAGGSAVLPAEKRADLRVLCQWFVGATDVCPPSSEFPG